MMQMTRRDEQMLDWLNVVRIVDVDAIRWALAGLKCGFADRPVSVRRANQWIARMADAGLVDRVRPMYRDRQIVWPTQRATGRSAPRLFRQTMRHELAVAAISARYLAAGYSWTRDSVRASTTSHLTDGVACRNDEVILVEIELTVKMLSRYRAINEHLGRELATNRASRVEYFCTPAVAQAVEREADKFVFRDERPRFNVHSVLDEQGRIADEMEWKLSDLDRPDDLRFERH